ncbi:hypothetical protein BURCENBC7_AP0358 [Burkholderia cenocepacia BC7]|nr:hypothetical protein BURCENK562V_C3812 [Burkholderia cenocepacia K56-2Valvano]ERI25129.1 hypothetical protein BURCENBC7_AP0358 [Burkholderia cenocepacia BC7]
MIALGCLQPISSDRRFYLLEHRADSTFVLRYRLTTEK